MPSIQHKTNEPFLKATFGMGCFWAGDALFGAQQGVLRTRVGYSGGTTVNPTYRNMGDHTEVVDIDYDPKVITYQDLLELFWNNHEYGLTTVIKRQYMSVIYYHNEDQKKVAENSMKNESCKRNEELITEVHPAGIFYAAEDYHQKYRLQEHAFLKKHLQLTPELLQTSHVAARINGYVAGVGKSEDFENEVTKLGFSEDLADYVRKEMKKNTGGTLYC